MNSQRERMREKNRFLALRDLVEKLEVQQGKGGGAKTAAERAADKKRKQKARRKRKSGKKLAAGVDIGLSIAPAMRLALSAAGACHSALGSLREGWCLCMSHRSLLIGPTSCTILPSTCPPSPATLQETSRQWTPRRKSTRSAPTHQGITYVTQLLHLKIDHTFKD